jgi:hypothetical protein
MCGQLPGGLAAGEPAADHQDLGEIVQPTSSLRFYADRRL